MAKDAIQPGGPDVRAGLHGQVALVTGGSQGIGRATAEMLASAGADIVLNHFSATAEMVEQVSRSVREVGRRVVAVEADVACQDEVAGMVERAVEEFGRIDILVNNAGIARSETPAENVTDEHWLNVVDVNLNGTFWCCRAFGKHMLDARSGSIVNIGSMSGFIVNKPQEQCYYNASKAAVHHLTKSLAAEWGARGVRVNAVAPTYITTPLNAFVKSNPRMYDAWIGGTPMARMGEVDEIASVVLFLASEAASLMTGSVVLVDGGYTCW